MIKGQWCKSLNEKEIDIEDWAIRQMRALGFINMKQMIWIMRIFSRVPGRKKRFSDKQIKKICK